MTVLCNDQLIRATAAATGSTERLITVVLGTRPEAVKLSPVVRALARDARVRLVLTGQHREMVDDLLVDLELRPDVQLGVMRERQTLNGLTARLVQALGVELDQHRPDAVIVQGDTTTAMCAALASFHLRIPVAHVEAGLRSGDRTDPFPEEANRRVITQLATWHFAPTSGAAHNLVNEGLKPDTVHVTGNTVIDSLLWVRARNLGTSSFSGHSAHRLLVTLHRREAHGPRMARMCESIRAIADELGLEVVMPVHKSPAVRESVLPALSDSPHVRLVEPLGYVDFVATLADATLVLTDSGGIQEEAPALGIPVLVARNTTERPEAVEAGCAKLVGTDPENIESSIRHLAMDRAARAEMSGAVNPFGDGFASRRICSRILDDLADTAGHSSSPTGLRSEESTCVSI